jgi:hypothetical protein
MEPPGQTHTHPDKGTFTFYSHGQVFAADSGVTFLGADDHNTVLCDGHGQQGGQGATDAIVRVQVASRLADVTWMDVKPAYEQFLSTTETDGAANWAHWTYGKGLPLYWKKVDSYDHVDRYTIFVRGEPDAYAVIVDDVQKDHLPHAYDWLLLNNPPGEIVGQTVTYRSRYGGPYVQSGTAQKPARFTANVPAAGEYSVWVLGRPWPDLKNAGWFSTMRLNGTWSEAFYLGQYCDDWQWIPIKHKVPVPAGQVSGGQETARWQFNAGANNLEFDLKRGARIAQVLLAADPSYTPTAMITNPAEGQMLCQFEAEKTGADWSISTQPDPRPQMQTIFFQPGAEKMKLWFDNNFRQRNAITQRLVVDQQAVRAGFAALLLPSDATEVQPWVKTDPASGQVTLRRGLVTDYLFANPAGAAVTRGALATDAKFALVRVRGGAVVGYVLAGGTSLKLKGHKLVSATAPVFLSNDGTQLSITGPQGAHVTAESIGAGAQVSCNHNPLRARVEGKQLKISVPVLAKEWKITFSRDQRVCTVTGDGPQPLKILAPKTINCIVNGVSTYFSRAPGGYIYPKLDVTVATWGSEPPAE